MLFIILEIVSCYLFLNLLVFGGFLEAEMFEVHYPHALWVNDHDAKFAN